MQTLLIIIIMVHASIISKNNGANIGAMNLWGMPMQEYREMAGLYMAEFSVVMQHFRSKELQQDPEVPVLSGSLVGRKKTY